MAPLPVYSPQGYGDVDASGPRARTSLPTGACLLGPDELLVCDTLNHKVSGHPWPRPLIRF